MADERWSVVRGEGSIAAPQSGVTLLVEGLDFDSGKHVEGMARVNEEFTVLFGRRGDEGLAHVFMDEHHADMLVLVVAFTDRLRAATGARVTRVLHYEPNGFEPGGSMLAAVLALTGYARYLDGMVSMDYTDGIWRVEVIAHANEVASTTIASASSFLISDAVRTALNDASGWWQRNVDRNVFQPRTKEGREAVDPNS